MKTLASIYTILYYTIQYYIILYYTILYYTPLQILNLDAENYTSVWVIRKCTNTSELSISTHLSMLYTTSILNANLCNGDFQRTQLLHPHPINCSLLFMKLDANFAVVCEQLLSINLARTLYSQQKKNTIDWWTNWDAIKATHRHFVKLGIINYYID